MLGVTHRVDGSARRSPTLRTADQLRQRALNLSFSAVLTDLFYKRINRRLVVDRRAPMTVALQVTTDYMSRRNHES